MEIVPYDRGSIVRMMPGMFAIPTIALGSDGAESDPATVKEIGDALRDVGFFAVEGHGVPSALVDQAYVAAMTFFEQPATVKSTYARPDLLGQRGYTGFAGERAIGASAADLKEFFQLGRERGSSAYGPNLWPMEPPAFREAFIELYDQLESFAVRIAKACSLYLGRGADFLPSRIAGGESVLRVIHYPPLPPDVPTGAVRAAAHADINFLTLLVGATADGLEIKTRDGRWHAVTARPGQIIVDSGDMLQNLTGGLFRSTVHRVVNPQGKNESRFSIPFFVHPRAQVDLTPLPGLAAVAVKAYPSLTADEFLRQRLAAIRPSEPVKDNHAS